MKSTWRIKAQEVIAEVDRNNPGVDEATLRKLISKAYPFGERKYHPYKIWLSAVNAYFYMKKHYEFIKRGTEIGRF